MSDGLQIKDGMPVRPRARRDIKGKSPSGFEVAAFALADPIPGTLKYGPFQGAGHVTVTRASTYVIRDLKFDEVPEIISILQGVLAAAGAPHEIESQP